jgi:hypothetical protein
MMDNLWIYLILIAVVCLPDLLRRKNKKAPLPQPTDKNPEAPQEWKPKEASRWERPPESAPSVPAPQNPPRTVPRERKPIVAVPAILGQEKKTLPEITLTVHHTATAKPLEVATMGTQAADRRCHPAFGYNDILRGVVWAEILQAPRSKRSLEHVFTPRKRK